jgi:hypothetical protein
VSATATRSFLDFSLVAGDARPSVAEGIAYS